MNGAETMNPRERLTKALNHEAPDRVPIDLGGLQTGIHRNAYAALLDHLGMREEIHVLDPTQQIARPSEAILQRFHVDTRYIAARPPEGFDASLHTSLRDGKRWYELRGEFGVVWSMPEDRTLFMDITHNPLANASVGDLAVYPFPRGDDASRFRGVRVEAQRLKDATNAAICTATGGVVYETCWYMRGLQQWFMDMVEDPGFCEALLDRILQYWMDFYTGYLGEVGDLVDVVMVGDDLTGQSGPLFSPAFYRKVVKPRQKWLVQHIKSLTPAKIWYHTCGSCVEYIPDLIDNGADVLNPVQISADNMDPRDLKRRFGPRISFWGGGIDAQHVLPFGTPEQVRDEVRRNLEAFKPGGGYVFNGVNNIQSGVPAQNIVALYDAAYEYGFYR